MTEGTRIDEWIPLSDGTRLSVTLFIPPESAGPNPCIIEALPYRKDDLTASYRPESTTATLTPLPVLPPQAHSAEIEASGPRDTISWMASAANCCDQAGRSASSLME